MGAAGCGLALAAFCETFDRPAADVGRAGELDVRRWSGSRVQPQLPTWNDQLFAIQPASLPACRAGLEGPVRPSRDALVCDEGAAGTAHLLVVTAAQNYGQTSHRIRQPFDFYGRTGTIVFDAEAMYEPLLGWISVEITEDPIAVPSYGVLENDEGGVLPRNGIEVQLNNHCNTDPTTQVSVGAVHVFDGYADRVISGEAGGGTCVAVREGRLDHFEIRLSRTRIEIDASDHAAADGTLPRPKRFFASDIDLPFTRGYVHISTHNHATLKYTDGSLDAWRARWDNVGFDGPVVGGWRESEVGDSLTRTGEGDTNVGYRVADEADGPADVLHLRGVDPTGVERARLALTAWYLRDGSPLESYVLRYRLNGGPWHDRRLLPEEIAAITHPVIVGQPELGGTQGALAQLLDVPPTELRAGDNTLELVSRGVPQNYPPAVLNVDLVMEVE